MSDLSDEDNFPKARAEDHIHTLAKAGISALPIIGGPAAELFAAIIIPPLARRRDKWVQALADELRQLEQTMEDFNLENLSENEQFITTVMHATSAAIRNHQEEKLEALRNAVLNSALPNSPNEDLQLTFLHFIDTFTPWHLRILSFFSDPIVWADKNNIRYPQWMGGGPGTVLEFAYQELKGHRDFYDQLVKELYSRGLLNIDTLHVSMTLHGMLASRTTDMGKKFLDFITHPKAKPISK